MPSPRSLLSLNEDILREILAHLLLDTPRELNRTSILRTCSSLHELGLPSLYRVVDLTGCQTIEHVMRLWGALFGTGGLLENSGGQKGELIFELRMGGVGSVEEYLKEPQPTLQVAELKLPKCSTLLLDLDCSFPPRFQALQAIIHQLPITHLVTTLTSFTPSRGVSGFSAAFNEAQVHKSFAFQPWRKLETIVFRGRIPHEIFAGVDLERDTLICVYQISLWNWSFTKLIVEDIKGPFASLDSKKIVQLFFFYRSSKQSDQPIYLDVERIEFRVKGEPEVAAEAMWKEFKEFKQEEKQKKGTVGSRPSGRRLLPLFVFVSEDGREARFESIE